MGHLITALWVYCLFLELRSAWRHRVARKAFKGAPGIHMALSVAMWSDIKCASWILTALYFRYVAESLRVTLP